MDVESRIGKPLQQQFFSIFNEIHKVVVGQDEVIEQILICLFTGGHILLEGVPGLGKTLMAKAIARVLDCSFKRIQGTRDLAPSDIIGRVVYDEVTGEHRVVKGPIFTNLLLFDEINRAPPKTQAALLEAMEEKHVSLGGQTFELPKPFMVIATQNPIEQEGVYPLPEAQQDRFLFKSVVSYLSPEEELSIMRLRERVTEPSLTKILSPPEVLIIQREIEETVEIPDSVLSYVVRIVDETRRRKELIAGASPRASIAFVRACKARAYLRGAQRVEVEDVRAMAYPILRHRLVLYPHYRELGVKAEDIIEKILRKVQPP